MSFSLIAFVHCLVRLDSTQLALFQFSIKRKVVDSTWCFFFQYHLGRGSKPAQPILKRSDNSDCNFCIHLTQILKNGIPLNDAVQNAVQLTSLVFSDHNPKPQIFSLITVKTKKQQIFTFEKLEFENLVSLMIIYASNYNSLLFCSWNFVAKAQHWGELGGKCASYITKSFRAYLQN